ncbi:Clavaminate synthase-like protein [Truncatella angustata]|uniref:Clavaminate synthase-like protein n=1 Tax=Truncatella angustata TaxID=152316 RepID=A0A9P8UII2_9PEZI|nr:Clavaminate synthase-like protein [Truncatella angustata]KAH6652811.1 Clavaminate synthase-like protein [Truncatella angustata]KAH8198283.1 hypothetical protein TruAng_007533 [Truncatella angustata]
MASASSTIPVLDLQSFTAGSHEDRTRIARDITSACRLVGFAYIKNHGVSSSLINEAFAWSKKLFSLPQEQKMLAPHPPGPNVHRGYSWPGLEKVSQYIHVEGDNDDVKAEKMGEELRQVVDCKESYEIGSETFALQPNVWLPQDVLPGFREFMVKFYWECFETAKTLLRALAIGIGIEDEEYFLRFHSGESNQLRLLHYPPIETEKLTSETAARMPAHSDWGSITLLFQDDCGGLQVEDPNEPGRFIDAISIKDALIMNVGDLLMRWSNDHLKSTLHRVTVPPVNVWSESSDKTGGKELSTTRMTKSRYSIPYFVTTDPTARIECLPQCTGKDNPPKYTPILQEDYRRMRSKTQYSDRVAT